MEKSAQPFVSVITPVYNGEKFLSECIESVLEQTYDNWEYTILDNCSTDSTLEIAKQYESKDERIRVITNDKFLKQIQNMNAALQVISPDSKYCKEIHADDCLMPECLEKMVAKAEEYPTAGIISSYRFINSEVASLYGKGLSYTTDLLSGDEVMRRFMANSLYLFGTPTTLLYRSDIVRAHETFYDPTVFHADTEACLGIMQEADLAFVHQILSFTRRHDEATTSFADRYNTYSLFRLYTIKKYGNDYLTLEELESKLSWALMEEYRWLFRSLLNGKAKEVWSYHKKELDRLGLSVEKTKLLKAFFIEISRMIRTDKIQAFTHKVAESFHSTPSSEDAVQNKVIEEKKQDTVLSKNEMKEFLESNIQK